MTIVGNHKYSWLSTCHKHRLATRLKVMIKIISIIIVNEEGIIRS